ncbi:phosphotransferase family protein [Nocardia wallacei]|uniref:phosphotransferase family protein n=1 Tax=Nocardia wallacei TaxID=480035 RepID=UPI0024579597|nr:phosphotransferase [Nocardia wallacei]
MFEPAGRLMTDDEQRPHRVGWGQLPGPVRVTVENRLGARVESVTVPAGGYSHGMASVLQLDDGRTVFAKAIHTNDTLAHMYRTEADTTAGLPAAVPVPTVLFSLETDGWLVTAFEAVEGRHPRLDQPTELAAVLHAVEQLATALTPCPLEDVPTIAQSYGTALTGWQEFAADGPPADLDEWPRRNLTRLAELETTWMGYAAGNTLLHTDIRPDNLMIRSDGSVVVVDWAWPCVGAAWVDAVSLAPSMLAVGVDPDPVLAGIGVDKNAVDAFAAGLAGYWARNCRQPAPPRSPHLRDHQARNAELSPSHGSLAGYLGCDTRVYLLAKNDAKIDRWLRRRLRWLGSPHRAPSQWSIGIRATAANGARRSIG